MSKEPEECPHCKASLLGEEIPKEHQKHYNGKKFYSKTIGLYDQYRDMITSWMCPECGHTWDRK